jgi:hypothetical protein
VSLLVPRRPFYACPSLCSHCATFHFILLVLNVPFKPTDMNLLPLVILSPTVNSVSTLVNLIIKVLFVLLISVLGTRDPRALKLFSKILTEK